MSASPHAAVVLAAGGSTRLGYPKQLLLRDGQPLVRRAIHLASQTRPARLLAIVGAHAPRVLQAIDAPCEPVVNPRWTHGLSSSVHCAATALREHRGQVLVLGCDQPALELEHLAALLRDAAVAPSGCAAVVHEARLGSPAVVTMDLLRQAQTLAGDRGLGGVLNALPEGRVARLCAPDLAFDVDLPADVQRAVERGWLDPAAPSVHGASPFRIRTSRNPSACLSD